MENIKFVVKQALKLEDDSPILENLDILFSFEKPVEDVSEEKVEEIVEKPTRKYLKSAEVN
jgi:hypothetical protein